MKIDLNNGEGEMVDEDKCFQDGISGGGSKITFQGSDLKVNAANEGEIERTDDRNQQTQNTVESWDRFLNVSSIRILLVENDDSTRHVVSALLRNCNYEVIDASNGRQAWKILEDLTNHIDIVLTEIVLPSLSGIALLRKITSHKSRKNIPVIMMSSHDSMSLVFNCLSKGAVNFLVKPIRKNELKNFWQYVWRRCHSSSGSGSESGTQTKKSVKSKSSQKADNSGSDDGVNNVINGLNVGDGSDDGNGTQSSWTKPSVEVVEVDSSLSMSPNEHVSDCPDSTCAQVISPNSENSGQKGVTVVLAREADGQSQPDTVAKGKDLEKITPKNVESKSENPMKIPAGAKPKSLSDLDCNMSIKQVDKGQLNLTGEKISAPLVDGKESGSAREVAIILDILDINNYATDESKEANFELSIKRLRGVQESGGSVQDDRCVLPRYEQSAFSRYTASSNIFKAPGGTTRSSSLTGNSAEGVKNRSVSDAPIHSTEHVVYQSSNEASNNIDMGSTTNKSQAHPSIMNNKSQTTSKVNSLHSSPIRPMKNNLRYTQPHISYNELSLKQLAEDALQCGSTNVMSGSLDCNLQNYSLNRSGSGSNHGSNSFVNGVGTYMNSDFGQVRKSLNGNASRGGSGAGADENRLTLREAAVIKFRQKRKDRTFKKNVGNLCLHPFKETTLTVRYQTRKKLAEQRPRVRGQFVKQSGMDSSNKRKDE